MIELDASISLPEGWFLAQPDPAEPGSAIEDQVDAHLRRRQDLEPFRQIMIDAIADYGRGCAAAGSLQSALRWDVTRDKQQSPVFAFLDMQRFEDGAEGSVADRIDGWRATAAEGHPTDEVRPQVVVVDLASGPAVRSEYVRPAGEHDILRLVVEFYLPVAAGGTVKLIFSTSNLMAANALVPEFDAIATRLELRSR